MTPTRQRHDGTKARFETVSALMALSTLTRFDRIARNYFSSCSFSRFSISPAPLINPAIRTAAVVALAVSASSAKAAEKIVGVPGWTTGTQTYLRARPSADTPAVAKVPRHTKLYVWGKFDGWYRVETFDHTFGWIYHPYVNAPAADKIVELSHKKAKLASNRTANQEMFGSPEVLKNYRETYGYLHEKPATRTRVASSSKPKARVSSTRISTRTRVQTKEQTSVRSPLRTISTRVEKPSGVTRVVKPVVTKSVVAKPADNSAALRAAAVRAAAVRAEALREEAKKREALRVADAQRQAENNAKQAQVAEQNRQARIAKAQADEKARANAEKYAYEQRVIAEQKRMARAAAKAKADANAREVARKARIARLERERAARAARYKKRLAARAAARQARLARYRTRLAAQQRREKQRQQVMAMQREQSASASSSLASTNFDLRPISPQELARARKDYLDGRISVSNKNVSDTAAPSPLNQDNNMPEGFAPSSHVYTEVKQNIVVTPQSAMASKPATIPRNLTLPLGNSVTTKTVVTTIASAKKQPAAQKNRAAKPLTSRGGSPRMRAGMRGGSPRDYARYRAQGSLFGQTMTKQALTYRGRPYIMGAASPARGFDCSGLIYFLLRQRGYNPPRTAAGLSRFGTSVPRDQLQPGDILLFANTYKRGISHAGIYMGNNKFVHAANRKRGVSTDTMSGYWAKKYWGARRAK